MPTPDYISPCGTITLYQGDCLAVLPELEAGSVDAVVTDPPYSSGGFTRGDRTKNTRDKYQSSDVQVEHPTFTGDNRDQRAWTAWVTMWLLDCAEVAVPGAMLCMFTDWRQLPCATDAIQAAGWLWMGIVPWDKVVARPMPNRFRAQAEFIPWGTNGPRDFSTNGAAYHDGAYRITTTPTAEREHSTQKPIDLMNKLVMTAPPEGTVLDPFAGSGTTAVACVNQQRKFIGVEKSPQYFDIAVRRIESALSDQALFTDHKMVQGVTR